MNPKTLQEAVVYFSNPENCLNYLVSRRFPNGVICPTCGRDDVSFLAKQQKWQCKSSHARRQFSIKTGTIFEDSALGLDKWLIAMWLIGTAKNGISSYELHRALGITQKSAWFVLHRIRTAMTNGTIEKLSGTVEIDEAYIGGLPKNMHQSKRVRFVKPYTRQFPRNKTAVFGMVERGGKVRAKVIKKGNTLRTDDVMPIIKANVEPESKVFTDQAIIYRDLWEKYVHASINHSRTYVRGEVHTNNIENFWSLLKRAIKGTYISVSPAHLQKYVEEQMFRYNEREGNDQMRFMRLIELISGKRLTYAELIGYETGC